MYVGTTVIEFHFFNRITKKKKKEHCDFVNIIFIIVALCVGVSKAPPVLWRTTMLQFPVVGKHRTVAGFAQLLSLNKRTVSPSCCRPRVPPPWLWARGRDDGSLQQLAC